MMSRMVVSSGGLFASRGAGGQTRLRAGPLACHRDDSGTRGRAQGGILTETSYDLG